MPPPPPRFDITADQINTIVARFYARVRRDDVLGPIFAAHVTDWPLHEEKIARFWRSAILFEGSYDGNPMRAHVMAGNVEPAMFAHWLGLFDTILGEVLPAPSAAAFSALAHRIGAGQRMGLEDFQSRNNAVPILR